MFVYARSHPMTDQPRTLPVVVIGAGPVGLAAAANLRAYGLPALVLEAGERVGAAVREWGHVATFTPWRYIVDAAAEKLLAPTGWPSPDLDMPPTGAELAEWYLEPLAGVLESSVVTGTEVLAVSRDGLDKSRSIGRDARPFLVRTRSADGAVDRHHRSRCDRRVRHLEPEQPARRRWAAGVRRSGGSRGRVPGRARCPMCSAATATGLPAGGRWWSALAIPRRTRPQPHRPRP